MASRTDRIRIGGALADPHSAALPKEFVSEVERRCPYWAVPYPDPAAHGARVASAWCRSHPTSVRTDLGVLPGEYRRLPYVVRLCPLPPGPGRRRRLSSSLVRRHPPCQRERSALRRSLLPGEPYSPLTPEE